MSLARLDSRSARGTDIDRLSSPLPTGWGEQIPSTVHLYPQREPVRVIIARLGPKIRMSAPKFNIVVEGDTQLEVWQAFLDAAKQCDETEGLGFDVGFTRQEEISRGLDVPEDEDWSALLDDARE